MYVFDYSFQHSDLIQSFRFVNELSCHRSAIFCYLIIPVIINHRKPNAKSENNTDKQPLFVTSIVYFLRYQYTPKSTLLPNFNY